MADSTAGRGQLYVHPDVLAGSINSQLPKWQRVRSHPPASGVEEPPPFFPNPDYKLVPAGLTLADQAHWVSRLRGTAEPAAGYYITGGEGRTAAMREIASWINDPDRGAVAVVTGRPGSGKSALLALPALVTDLAYRESLLAAAGDRPIVRAANLVRPDTRVIAVHGRGLNADQLASTIAAGLGRDAGTADGLLDALEREPAPDHPVVLLDGLDETEQPGVVAGQLVTELVRHGLRVVIGTRGHLLKAIANPSLLVDLDEEPYADAQALTDYVTQLLVAGHEPGVATPYQPLQHRDDDTLATIAAAVSTKAAGSFLIGQLIALALRGRDQVVDTEHLDDIPASVGEAFDADLARLGSRSAHARVLLTALAWAKGPGLPWENIWVPVVNAIRPALAARTSEPLRDGDIRWLRDEAGAYIVEDTGTGGRSVFRPFHDLLAAHLRASGEAPGHETLSAGHRERVNGLVTDALLAGVPTDETGARLWAQAHPYLRSYLAQHAADAGADRLTALLTGDPGYLAAADPATFVPLLLREQLPGRAETSGVYRRAAPFLGADVRWNAAYLQEAALVLGAHGLLEAFAADRLAPAFDTVIAQQRADASLLAFTGHPRGVQALAVVPLPGGRTLLASGGSYDSAVRLWDPATGGRPGRRWKATPTGCGRSRWCRCPAGGPCWRAGAATARCGCGTRQPAGRPGRRWKATPDGCRRSRWCRCPAGGPCWRAGARTGCGCGTRQPASRPGRRWKATPVRCGRSRWCRCPAGGPCWRAGAATTARCGCGTRQPAGRPDRRWEATRPNGCGRRWKAIPARCRRSRWCRCPAGGPCWRAGARTGCGCGTRQPATRPGRRWKATPAGCGRSRWCRCPAGGPCWRAGARAARCGCGTRQPATRPGRRWKATPDGCGRSRWCRCPAGGPCWRAGAATTARCGCGTRQPAEPGQAAAGRPRRMGAGAAAVPLPGGRTLLASGGSDDGTVRLWDPATGEPGQAAAGRPRRFGAGARGGAAARRADPAGQRGRGRHGAAVGPGNRPACRAAAGRPRRRGVGARGGAAARRADPAGERRRGRHGAAVGPGNRRPAGPPLEGHATEWAGPPLIGHPRGVTALAAVPLPGGRTLLASGGEDGTVRLWDPATGQAGPPLEGHADGVQALAAVPLPGGRTLLASGGSDGTVRLWDLGIVKRGLWRWRKHSHRPRPPLEGHTGWVRALAAVPLPGGRTLLASGGADGTVRLWDIVNSRVVARICPPRRSVDPTWLERLAPRHRFRRRPDGHRPCEPSPLARRRPTNRYPCHRTKLVTGGRCGWRLRA